MCFLNPRRQFYNEKWQALSSVAVLTVALAACGEEEADKVKENETTGQQSKPNFQLHKWMH